MAATGTALQLFCLAANKQLAPGADPGADPGVWNRGIIPPFLIRTFIYIVIYQLPS